MLEGKTVNINREKIGLLLVMYPDFEFREELFFDKENKIIYVGRDRKNLVGYLSENTKEFINTVGPYDFDLENREVLLDLVYSKWNKEIGDDLKSAIIGLPEEDFYSFVKRRWVLRRGDPLERSDNTIYDLYKVFGKSKSDSLSVYFKLLKDYPAVMIESSLLTFLEKSVGVEDISASGHYMKLLKDFKSRHGEKIKPVLYKYKVMDYDVNMNVLWLLLQF